MESDDDGRETKGTTNAAMVSKARMVSNFNNCNNVIQGQ
jgi:hypothetical protein